MTTQDISDNLSDNSAKAEINNNNNNNYNNSNGDRKDLGDTVSSISKSSKIELHEPDIDPKLGNAVELLYGLEARIQSKEYTEEIALLDLHLIRGFHSNDEVITRLKKTAVEDPKNILADLESFYDEKCPFIFESDLQPGTVEYIEEGYKKVVPYNEKRQYFLERHHGTLLRYSDLMKEKEGQIKIDPFLIPKELDLYLTKNGTGSFLELPLASTDNSISFSEELLDGVEGSFVDNSRVVTFRSKLGREEVEGKVIDNYKKTRLGDLELEVMTITFDHDDVDSSGESAITETSVVDNADNKSYDGLTTKEAIKKYMLNNEQTMKRRFRKSDFFSEFDGLYDNKNISLALLSLEGSEINTRKLNKSDELSYGLINSNKGKKGYNSDSINDGSDKFNPELVEFNSTYQNYFVDLVTSYVNQTGRAFMPKHIVKDILKDKGVATRIDQLVKHTKDKIDPVTKIGGKRPIGYTPISRNSFK